MASVTGFTALRKVISEHEGKLEALARGISMVRGNSAGIAMVSDVTLTNAAPRSEQRRTLS